jgi:hypothetical protein
MTMPVAARVAHVTGQMHGRHRILLAVLLGGVSTGPDRWYAAQLIYVHVS